MSERVFIERTVEVDGENVICRFHQPVADPQDYRCDIDIEWPEGTKSKRAYGVDAIQALLLAMQLVHTDLLAAREMNGRQVSWLGDRSLGLPIAKTIRDWDPENSL